MESLSHGKPALGEGAAAAAVPAMVMPPAPSREDDEEGWRTALAKAQVALEAQTLRAVNAELASKYGVEQWQAHVAALGKSEAVLRARVSGLQTQVETIKASRRTQQDRVKGKLETLGKRAASSLDSITSVQSAVADAEAEVRRLKRAARGAGLLPDDDVDGDDDGGAIAGAGASAGSGAQSSAGVSSSASAGHASAAASDVSAAAGAGAAAGRGGYAIAEDDK